MFPLALAVCFLQPTIGQDLLRKLEMDAPIRPPLKQDAVEDTLELRVQTVASRLQHATSKAAIGTAKPELRRHLTDSLGYQRLPWPPDLRATALGKISGAGYHVEKVGYQTLPNVLVPALIYVPDNLTAPASAVLVTAAGTWTEGKAQPEAQAFAIQMARLGFIVMIADPIGAGERRAPGNRGPFLDALLVGVSEAGIVEYETRCALLYLTARKDVDATRIGLTGGFNAWITMALDEKISSAFIVDGTEDLAELVRRMRPVDWNQSQAGLVPGILQYANIQELIGMAAPRPVMISSPSGVRPIFEFAKAAYGGFDQADQAHFFESDGDGYEVGRREGAYGFFLQALMKRGDGSPVREPVPRVTLRGAAELTCLPGGQLAPATEGVLAAVRKLAASNEASAAVPPEALAGAEPDWGTATLGINAFAIHRRNLASEKGIEIPVTILWPNPGSAGGNAGTLLAIDDQDKESLTHDPIVEEALRRDYVVVEMDPRGFGELAVAHPSWVSAASLLLGENFVWRQAWDICRRLDGAPFVRGANKVRAVYARGPKASLAAAYGLWLMRAQIIDWAVLRGGLTTIRQLFDNSAIADYSFGFGVARSLDLQQLLAATKTKTFVIEPLDAGFAVHSARVRVASMESFLAGAW